MWTPSEGEERVLLLGGRFLSSDLTDLFEVLSTLPLSDVSASLILDEDNTVVGFTRIRSLQWVDQGETSLLGHLISKPLYLGITNGYFAISESESQIMELIFSLNGRKPLKDSAQPLVEQQKDLSLSIYQDDEMSKSVKLDKGRLVIKLDKSLALFYKFFSEATKNYAD